MSKEYFLNEVWKIGTAVKTYYERGILNWIKSTVFQKEYINGDSISHLKKDWIVYKDGTKEEFVFYNSDKDEKKLSDNTLSQVVRFMQICQILELTPSNEKTFDYHLKEEFRLLLKSYPIEEWEKQINNYVFNKIMNSLNVYIKAIDNWNKNKEDEDSEEEKDLEDYFTDYYKQMFILSKNNWMNSVIAGISKNLSNNISDKNFNLIKNYLNSNVNASIESWGSFCSYICKDQDQTKCNEIVENFIKVLGIKEEYDKDEKLHFNYFDQNSKSLENTSVDKFYSYPERDVYEDFLDSENVPFYSYVCNLNYLLNYSTIINKCRLPLYQRNYSWNERLIKILFEDIKEISTDLNRKHFLGGITFSQHNNKINIVDGQQRTITLILFSYALYKIILLHNYENESKIAMPKIFIEMFRDRTDWMQLKDYKESESYQFLDILLSSNVEEIRRVFPPKKQKEFKYKIKNNLDYIWEILSEEIGSNKEKIENFTKSFVENLYFNAIFINTQYEDKIFEKMNLLSQRLNNIDLLNSLIYKLWDPKKHPKHVSTFKENISQHFYKTKNNETVEDEKKIEIFADFINYKHDLNYDGEKNNDYTPYFILKTFIETQYEKYNGDFEKILNVISKDLWIFKFILTQNTEKLNELFDSKKIAFAQKIHEKNKEMLRSIFPFVCLTKVADTTVLFSIVYSILKKFNIIDLDEFKTNEENSTNFKKAIRWLFEIERFQWIWKTSYFEGQSIRKVVKRWADKILNRQNEENIEDIKDLRKELYKWINPQSSIEGIFSTFAKDMENRLLEPSKRNKSSNKDYVMLMRRVECFLLNDFNNFPNWSYLDNPVSNLVSNLFDKNSSWEHFYSRNIKKGSEDLEIEKAQKETNLIDSIGNGFVLNMKANSQAKNNPPDYKYEKLYKHTERTMKSFTGVKLTINEAKDKYLYKFVESVKDQYKNHNEKFEILKIEKEWTKEKIEKRNKAIIALIQDIYSLEKSDK